MLSCFRWCISGLVLLLVGATFWSFNDSFTLNATDLVANSTENDSPVFRPVSNSHSDEGEMELFICQAEVEE
jgi:hypothetical protein